MIALKLPTAEVATLSPSSPSPASPAEQADLLHDQGGDSEQYHPLIACALQALEPGERSAWQLQEVASPGQLWIHVDNVHSAPARPRQGWKVHVSASPLSARQVLGAALSVLLRESATFKVAASLGSLLYLNQGRGGLSQVGKFITVYPNDDQQAVRLATALDRATYGFRGPGVPSDRPLRPGSLVYYRYGGFAGHHIHTKTGKVVSVISAPSGELTPDPRATIYAPPHWAVDPFVEAGVAAQLPTPSRIVGGRFMVIAPLYESAASTLYLAVDTDTPRKCVLKRARHDAAADKSGRDAVDRLRNEAAILSSLSSPSQDPHFPAFYGVVEASDGLYLALEYIEGSTLTAQVAGLSARHGMLPGEQLLGWAREIASALGVMHARGFVYRDLKSNNVMLTPEGRPVIIDFGLAHELGGVVAQFNMGTRGYMSPGHREWDPATPADDIYGFGALLYFLATRAEPSTAPDEGNLLTRPVELLNPCVAPALRDVIVRCLQPDPGKRYGSMSEVEAALHLISDVYIAPPAWGREIMPDFQDVQDVQDASAPSEPELRARYLALARALGDTLCNVAVPARNGQGVVWHSRVVADGTLESRAVNIGCSGQVLALAEVVREFGEERHVSTLREAVRWLLSEDPHEDAYPGLYVGESGVACALLRAGQVLQDPSVVEAASNLGKWIARTMPHESPDIFNGSAGRVRQHLLLWDETGDPEHLDFAIEAAESVLAMAGMAGMAEGVADGMCWPTPVEYGGNTFLGYAHGAAGVGDALLDLFEATGDERFLDAAIEAGRWLQKRALPLQGALIEGAQWPRHEGGTLNESFWCHGATGIGAFFLHLATLGALDGVGALAERAAVTAARATRWAVPVQCHGLAGNIEFLLDMYQATEERAYYTEARSLARLLETFQAREKGNLVWSSDTPAKYSPDYTIGYAGIAMCLLRLAYPEHLPRQLSRAGFRRGTRDEGRAKERKHQGVR